MAEIWVLGATGRTGRAVAARLHAAGSQLVLVGRDRARLEALAAELGGAPQIVAGTLAVALDRLMQAAPAVVVNTIGPFPKTAPRVIAACPPKTHYVDVANELPAVSGTLDLHARAIAAEQTLVTGSGFGVLGTESVVLRLCAGRPPAARVRVDAFPSLAIEPGTIGSALAASILDDFSAGGRQVVQGRLVRAGLADEVAHLTTPDGHALSAASLPSGELLAAWRASGAASVIAASGVIPSGPAVQIVLPVITALLRFAALRRVAIGRLARVTMRAQARPREFTWTHARVEWEGGEMREGWLRAGDAMDFTVAAVAEVAQRLARGEGQPGAYTPGALFGPSLATDAGGEFVL